MKIDLPDVVGRGYGTFWNFKGRYRVVKGSRASKKSKTAALWYVVNMVRYPQANTLVVRKTYRTLKDSCFSELKWAVHRLGMDNFWEFKESPLEATLTRHDGTRQKIYFRGLDDPLKVTSITVEQGCLCWMWIEEAYEVTSETDFDMLDESIRGETPLGLFKQITLTFNPWNERHWIKKRFFDHPSPDALAITTNYMCNEWLDDADKRLFEAMKQNNPRRYAVAGLGNWGIVDGLVYERWREQKFQLMARKEYDLLEEKPPDAVILDNLKAGFGLDFGYTQDPTAAFIGFVDLDGRKIYVSDELYERGLSNRRIYERLCEMGYGKEHFTADSAEPKSIDELKGYGMRVRGATKGKDSINNGIQWIQDFEIIIHPRCVNFLTEISNYSWDKDRFGNKLNAPADDFNHLMDAMRYGLEGYIKKNGWIY